MIRSLFFLTILFYSPAATAAVNIIVKGKVIEEKTGHPIAGVQIFIENSNLMTLTAVDGSYVLEGLLPGKYTLVAFSLGMQTQKAAIDVTEGTYTFNFIFSEISSEIEAVTIKDEKEETLGLKRLEAVDGFGIYESKKNEVIVLDDLVANKASNNARQIFAKVPGLNIWESDCAGLQIGIGSRGLSPDRNSNFNTRQNGHDISADALGYPESYYSPAIQAVERIEVVRGAASLQYGTQFGGLVNFVLKEGPEDEKFQWNTEQTYNSLGFYSGFNSVGGTIGKFNYYAYNRYAQGDCWRNNSEFKSNTSYGQIKFQPNDNVAVKLNYTNMYYLAQQPGGLTDNFFENDPRQSIRERNWFRVNWNLIALDIDIRINQKLRLNNRSFGLIGGRDALGNLGRIDRADTDGPRDLFVDDFLNMGNETRLLFNYNLKSQPSVLLIGARIYKGLTERHQGMGPAGQGLNFNFTNPENLEGSSYDFPGNNFSLFAENILNVSPKISITPGVRYEYIETKADGYYHDVIKVKDPATGLAVDSVFKVYENKSNPRDFIFFGLGASYNYSPALEFYFNISQNYRSVNFNDIRVVNPNFVVDENIKDENGYNIDLGIRGGSAGIFNYDLTVFYLRYNDRIGSILISDRSNFSYYRFRTNISDSRNFGLEAFGELDLLHSKNTESILNVFLNLSLINAQYISSQEAGYNGNQVEQVPSFSLKTGVFFTIEKLKASYQVSYTNQHYTDASNVTYSPTAIEGVVPGYYVMDVSLAYRINKYIQLQAGINNLTDNHYFTRRATGYPGPGIIPADGRGIYFTLRGTL